MVTEPREGHKVMIQVEYKTLTDIVNIRTLVQRIVDQSFQKV